MILPARCLSGITVCRSPPACQGGEGSLSEKIECLADILQNLQTLCRFFLFLYLKDESFAGRAPLFKTASQICSSGEPGELTCAAIEDVCDKLMRLKNGETVEMFE